MDPSIQSNDGTDGNDQAIMSKNKYIIRIFFTRFCKKIDFHHKLTTHDGSKINYLLLAMPMSDLRENILPVLNNYDDSDPAE